MKFTISQAARMAALLLMMPAMFTACSSDDDEKVPAATVSVKVDEASISYYKAQVEVSATNADSLKYFVTDDAAKATVQGLATEKVYTVKSTGTAGILSESKTVGVLTPATQYYVFAVAYNKSGAVSTTATFTTTERPFTSASGSRYNSGNSDLVLKAAGDIELGFDLYYPSYKFLPEGTYSILSEKPTSGDAICYALQDANKRYTYASVKGEKHAMTSGTLTVTVDLAAKTHKIVVDVTLDDGSKLTGVWNGAVEGYNVYDEMTVDMSACKRLSNDSYVAGECYLKFNNAEWSSEMALDFIGNSTDTTLQPGTYTVADTGAAGTLTQKSNIDIYYPLTAEGGYFASGQAVVEVSGNTYTITYDLTTKAGQRFVGKYSGEVTDMVQQ